MVQTHSVVSNVDFSLVVAAADPVRVAARLRYDVHDPFAVCVSFEAAGSDHFEAGESDHIDWTFARELLQRGLLEPSGEGDVKVWPQGGHVFLALCSPSGRAVLETPVAAIAEFVVRIQKLVPDGHEADFVNLDHELEQLLA